MSLGITARKFRRSGPGNTTLIDGRPVNIGLVGEVFVLDASVATQGDGGLNTPFNTWQAAIDAAVAGRGDVILAKPGGYETSTAVLFNKSRLQVIAVDEGLAPLSKGEYHSIYSASTYTDGPAALISASCSIEGIGFASRDTGATFYDGAAALIHNAAATIFGVWMKNCRFPKWGLDNRIGLAIAGTGAVADVLIEGCTFEGVGTSFDSGIYVQGAIQNLHVRHNYFRQCTYAIVHGAFAGGGPHCIYERNFCEDSKLLNAGGNAATGLICDNFLETATDTGSYDASVGTNQALGLQFSGNHYSE